MEIIPFISFFTGVISILSPCILPIIPIFVAFSLKSKSKSEIISFTLGLLSIFVVIIFLTGFFTSIVYSYIAYIRILSAILLLVIGILMLVDYSFSFKALTPKNKDGVVGSFILGFLTSISWAPCYSAYLISLISLLVSTNSGLYAIFNLILYCLGFALTLFILSLIISKINLERLITKTKYIPKIFAILIIISAIYLLWESFKVLI
ncbi:cytochrome C biogenesis protein [Methanobrevibacter sp. YE315]|uniref:cytochrome c biogenesis CcdA family protein n=1 Tax=Methanobrevibacter sp. YE315 TaxID=1609968 RepID=UPI000764E118|nr:cytochrome c biogenesis CcdA family protein [Methanobrevibacter sp. YE315]AMD17436.1 cytochrome C biogenesis protein [Methanobrevibacter sp. YE315]